MLVNYIVKHAACKMNVFRFGLNKCVHSIGISSKKNLENVAIDLQRQIYIVANKYLLADAQIISSFFNNIQRDIYKMSSGQLQYLAFKH